MDHEPGISEVGPWGCAACFQGDAAAVWRAKPFQSRTRLVEESHFSIEVMQCGCCGQRCVKVFTEFVDWVGGDDAQYWTVIPVTAAEAGQLRAQGAAVSTELIEGLSRGRRYLQADYPTGKEKRVLWSVGPVWIMRGG